MLEKLMSCGKVAFVVLFCVSARVNFPRYDSPFSPIQAVFSGALLALALLITLLAIRLRQEDLYELGLCLVFWTLFTGAMALFGLLMSTGCFDGALLALALCLMPWWGLIFLFEFECAAMYWAVFSLSAVALTACALLYWRAEKKG